MRHWHRWRARRLSRRLVTLEILYGDPVDLWIPAWRAISIELKRARLVSALDYHVSRLQGAFS